jgi:hypothetical protein
MDGLSKEDPKILIKWMIFGEVPPCKETSICGSWYVRNHIVPPFWHGNILASYNG